MNEKRPPFDWEKVYAADGETYTFGEEPSQIARSALSFFRQFGGDGASARALDLGCGEGRDSVFLAGAGMRVTARDLSPTGLEKLERLREKRNVPAERIDAQLADAQNFDYETEAYDLTLAANIYQFLPPSDVPSHIRRLQNATKPGGICAVGVFHPAMSAWEIDLSERFTATADELQNYFADGWQLLDRTEYWLYRAHTSAMMSFVFVVARKFGESL